VQQVADKLGLDSASRFYQAGVDQGKALVAGLGKRVSQIRKILANPKLTTKRLETLLDKAQTDIAFTQITAGQAVAAPAPTKASIANVNQAKANKGGTTNYTVNVHWRFSY
jgi:Zn-dependent M16 (insulinase) family peptidase